MMRMRYSAEEIVKELREGEVLIEGWRREYNTVRAHSSLRYRPPAPETIRIRGGWSRAEAGSDARRGERITLSVTGT